MDSTHTYFTTIIAGRSHIKVRLKKKNKYSQRFTIKSVITIIKTFKTLFGKITK